MTRSIPWMVHQRISNTNIDDLSHIYGESSSYFLGKGCMHVI